MRKHWKKILVLVVILVMVVIYLSRKVEQETRTDSNEAIGRWFSDPSSHPDLITPRQACPKAPFILPSAGFIGLLWRDPAAPYTIFRRHTGIDIFGDGEVGTVPVYAVYDGYLSRLPNWISSVVIVHDDPLKRRAYHLELLHPHGINYTHMASVDGSESFVVDDFPPGTAAQFVKQGTLLGYQGNYAGNVSYGIGMHLHMSLIQSEADGSFKNEADLDNTLDPSPYFGMDLNIDHLPARPIQCTK